MTLDESVALSLLSDIPRLGLTERLHADDPALRELASPLLDRARETRARAARNGISVVAWDDPVIPCSAACHFRHACRAVVPRLA